MLKLLGLSVFCNDAVMRQLSSENIMMEKYAGVTEFSILTLIEDPMVFPSLGRWWL